MHSIRLPDLVFIVSIAFVHINLYVSGIRDRYSDSRYMSSWSAQCRRPVQPKNGLMRIRNSGRTVRFQCKSGYVLLGEKRLVCKDFTWDKNPPVCIKSGCPLNETAIENAHVEQFHQGALIKFACYSGYVLSGPSVISCDGSNWNATIPDCWRNEEETSIGSCNLEKDLCGWVNSQNDNFDWQLNMLSTPSGKIGTGPSFDHTLGYGRKGHYLYLEASSPQSVNNTAVLISPYFPAVVTNETRCFIFWYHMYGAGIGKMNVYVNNTLNFTESGNHGNRWIRGVIPIAGNDIFKIEIEGVRGPTYAGDIAIDDFSIGEGAACEETEISPLLGSCSGRCFSDTVTDDNACYCSESCQTNSTCCADFYNICSIGDGTSTAQADLSSSPESKSIDSFTSASILASTTVQVDNSKVYLSTLPSSFLTTSTTYRPTTLIFPNTTISTLTLVSAKYDFENKSDSDKNFTRHQANSTNFSNSKLDSTNGQGEPVTPILEIPVISCYNSTQKKMYNESSTSNVTKTEETTRTPTTNNYLSLNITTSTNVTSNGKVNKNKNNASENIKTQTMTPNATQDTIFPSKSDSNQQLHSIERDDIVRKILGKFNGSSMEHLESAINQVIKELSIKKNSSILLKNVTLNKSTVVYSTREGVTKIPFQMNLTKLSENVTLKNVAKPTKMSFNLTSTTKIVSKSLTTRIFPTTTKNPNLIVTTIKSKLPATTWQKKTKPQFIDPIKKNSTKAIQKFPITNSADRVVTLNKLNNTRLTQNINFYNTSQRGTTARTFSRTTTQAAHMSVIKTKVDVSGRNVPYRKNGKLKNNLDKDKESQAPYVKSEQRDNTKATVAIISVFILVAIVCLVVAVFSFRRRINRDRAFDDDSDVQFLTSDELINFNLARPSPDRHMNSESCR